MNEAAAAATKNYLGMEGATAALGAGQRFMQGIGAVAKDPSTFAQGMGGLGKTLQAGMMAASPVLADQAVETTTDMPGYTPSTAYYRPYEFDPETKGLKSLGSVEAKGMAGGGLADLDSFKKAAERSGPMGINGKELMPQIDPIYGNDGRVSLFMGPGWYSGFASGQELEDLKAKQRAYFAGSLPAAAAPKTATGGISDLVYRPLSEVDEKARAQGIGKDRINDRAQGLEKAVRDLGLQDVHNQYGAVVNTSNDPRYSASGGNKYDPKFNYMEGAALDPNLQKYWMNAVAEDSSEQERQASARQLVDRLAALQGGAKTPAALPFTPTTPPGITSTEANRPTTTITPSTYSVRGEQIAPQTSTAPPAITSTEVVKPTTTITPSTYSVRGEQIAPQTSTAPPAITSTAAARPVAAITPAQLNTQQAAAVPLTSATAPAITATAAPTMPSMPVGGGGSAGAAAIRPFDYQSVPIERLPAFDQQNAENVMTGESLAAYQMLIGRGAQSQASAPQAAARVNTTTPASSLNFAGGIGFTEFDAYTNPLNQTIYGFKAMGGSAGVNPSTLGFSAGTDPTTGKPYQWAWDEGSRKWYTAKSNPFAAGGAVPGFALGGSIPGYAFGGQAEYNLGSYSDGGRLLRGPGDGVSDSIPATIGDKQPARLADGEFVVPARIVSELGNGSTESGARKLYTMMDRVQRARGQTTGANSVATNSHADQYLPA
jgi:hypothetical protein